MYINFVMWTWIAFTLVTAPYSYFNEWNYDLQNFVTFGLLDKISPALRWRTKSWNILSYAQIFGTLDQYDPNAHIWKGDTETVFKEEEVELIFRNITDGFDYDLYKDLVYSESHDILFFTDLKNDIIYKWSEEEGSSIFL